MPHGASFAGAVWQRALLYIGRLTAEKRIGDDRVHFAGYLRDNGLTAELRGQTVWRLDRLAA